LYADYGNEQKKTIFSADKNIELLVPSAYQIEQWYN